MTKVLAYGHQMTNDETTECGRKLPVMRMLHWRSKAVSPLRSATAVQNAGGLTGRVGNTDVKRIAVSQSARYAGSLRTATSRIRLRYTTARRGGQSRGIKLN